MRAEISKSEIRRAQSDAADPWRVGNALLYELCSRYPDHLTESEIIAKVWLIGRTYAAAIERGKGDTVGLDITNDKFYVQHVAPALQRSRLDAIIARLRDFKRPDQSNVTAVLHAHSYLTRLFANLRHLGPFSCGFEFVEG